MLNSFFFFNDTATTEIYTLSLHDALPIYDGQRALEMELTLHDPGDRPELLPDHALPLRVVARDHERRLLRLAQRHHLGRSEEHTSELQSLAYLVCRLLLEKKKLTSSPLLF